MEFKNKVLMQKILEEQEEEKRQEALRKKHSIEDEGVVVVEKKMLGKFILRLLISAAKTICGIAVILLACIGLMTLFYPQLRASFWTILQGIIASIF